MGENCQFKNLCYFGFLLVGLIFLIFKYEQLDMFTFLWYQVILAYSYIAAVHDFKNKSIPNTLILGMISTWFFMMIFKFFVDSNMAISLLKESMIGFFIGGILFLLVYILSKKGLGGGDVKYIAASGLYIGFSGILSVSLIGSLLAAIVGLILIYLKKIKPKDTMPLVPFLYIGILLTVFYM